MRTGDLILQFRHVSSHATKINSHSPDATPELDLSIPRGSNVGHYFMRLLIYVTINLRAFVKNLASYAGVQ